MFATHCDKMSGSEFGKLVSARSNEFKLGMLGELVLFCRLFVICVKQEDKTATWP